MSSMEAREAEKEKEQRLKVGGTSAPGPGHLGNTNPAAKGGRGARREGRMMGKKKEGEQNHINKKTNQ